MQKKLKDGSQDMRGVDESLLLEQHAERAALSRIWGVNFTHILHRRHIATEITFSTEGSPRGRRQTGESIAPRTWILRGTDIYDDRTWQKFLASREQRLELTNLVEGADLLGQEYGRWLLEKHTGRSRLLTAREHLFWLQQVAELVVLRRMMEAKYHLHLSSERGFADPWVAHVMESLLFTQLITGETAKAVYRACREPEQARSYIDTITQRLEGFLSDRSQVLRHDLPRLPQSASLPLLLASKQAQQQHEEKNT